MRGRASIAIVLAALTLATQAPAASAAAGSTRALAAALAQGRATVRAPAATAAVFHCGRLLWAGGSGTKQQGGGAAATPYTEFVIASTTKMVTATMIMELVQAGKLSLQTRLSRFYPQLPDASRITIRELLDQTSGLAEYLNTSGFAQLAADPRHDWTRDEVLSLVGAPQAQPGQRFVYTDTNFIVLGGIVEQLTGEAIQPAFAQLVARPAQLPNSYFRYGSIGVSRFAHPYLTNRDGSLADQFVPGVGISSSVWGEVWTDGGLATDALDFGRFLDALFHGRLVSSSTLAQMTTAGKGDYGLGMFPQQVAGHTWWGHNGSFAGYQSEGWHDQARDVTIVALTDRNELSGGPAGAAETIWQALERAYDAQPEQACG